MTGVASVYGQALYDLARDESLSESILGEMKVLSEAFIRNADFVRLLSSPGLSKDERLNIVHESFAGKVHPYVLNFMKILTEKGYMRHFSDCYESYREQYNADNGILPVKAVTAHPMTEDQIARLSSKLEKITGKKIELENAIDLSCIGGVRLDYDGKRVDDTVAGRLDRLHAMLKNTIL